MMIGQRHHLYAGICNVGICPAGSIMNFPPPDSLQVLKDDTLGSVSTGQERATRRLRLVAIQKNARRSWSRGPLQPGTNPRDEDVLLYRQSGTSAYLDELCRTTEPYHADEHAAVHAADERLFKKGCEPRAFGRDPLHALQLHSYPSEPTGHARNGVRSHAEALVVDRHGAGH
jgi:hypothetical protein